MRSSDASVGSTGGRYRPGLRADQAGANQSYWSDAEAVRDGATVMLRGECPLSRPGMDSGGGRSGMSEHGPSANDATSRTTEKQRCPGEIQQTSKINHLF
jgi:hypothetical protein